MKYKELYKKIEATVSAISFTHNIQDLIHRILEKVVLEYGPDLGITSGRLYVKKDDQYCLVEQFGEHFKELEGMCFPQAYLPIRKLHEEKYIIMDHHDFGLDDSKKKLLIIDTFAAIAIGDEDRYLVAFSVANSHDAEHLHYSLNTIRFVTNIKLKELDLKDEFLKAREIQMSLLPSYSAQLKTFDIHGMTRPADLVGGDAYDYIPINEDTLGVAVLDAVGHGLPAALQARDAIIGMRMGLAGNIKIDSVLMRLNQVIHRSNLASRFVSMFYGELEEYGHFVYANAGHPPPLFFTRTGIFELQRGGMVLGPNPKATYKRGFAYFSPGDFLVIFSDGITEARNRNNQEFGVDRLKSVFSEVKSLSAREMSIAMFSALDRFTGLDQPDDDQTVVIVRRIEGITSPF